VIAYVDSSVILRLVLGQAEPLDSWGDIDGGVVSTLVEVECFRTLDRLRLRERVADVDMSALWERVHHSLDRFEVVEATRAVLARAAQPFPTSLGTLDAVHLSTALLWREQTGEDLTLATHDGALALGARSFGLPVVGV
jgi:predicted nucleic acid-binding protein